MLTTFSASKYFSFRESPNQNDGARHNGNPHKSTDAFDPFEYSAKASPDDLIVNQWSSQVKVIDFVTLEEHHALRHHRTYQVGRRLRESGACASRDRQRQTLNDIQYG